MCLVSLVQVIFPADVDHYKCPSLSPCRGVVSLRLCFKYRTSVVYFDVNVAYIFTQARVFWKEKTNYEQNAVTSAPAGS